jgi:hypothetical protein
MSKIVVDEIQRLSGTASFTLPTTAGTAGQFMTTNGSGTLQFTTMPMPNYSAAVDGLVAPEGRGMVGAIYSHTDRQNIYSTGEWTSSGPWTTYVNKDAHADNSLIQFMNMALSDGYSNAGSTENMMGNDAEKNYSRQLMFSNGNRLGYARDYFHYDNNTGYAGHSFAIMPIRNTSGSAITVTINAAASDYWEQGYEGTCLFVLEPNTATYSTVTSVASTLLGQTTTNTRQTLLSGTYSVPANETILVCLASTDQYQTTYRFKDTNYFYNLNTTFSNPSIICDMRMLSSLYQSRFNLTYAGGFAGILPAIWTRTAINYGDR